MKSLLVVFLFASCAFAKDEAAVARSTAACGPDEVKFQVTHDDSVPQPATQAQANKALIFVIEDDKTTSFQGALTRVGVDGRWVGANKGRSFFSFSVDPGLHHLCVDWPSGIFRGRQLSLAGLNAEAGQTYYFRARAFFGRDGAIIDLDPVNSDQGQYLVASFPQSTSHSKK